MGQILLNLNACTSAFYNPILVSEFLLDKNTFKIDDDRKSALEGLKVYLTYDPKHSGGVRSRADTIAARMKEIVALGDPSNRQEIILDGGAKLTVQQHFKRSKFSTYTCKLQMVRLSQDVFMLINSAYNMVLQHPELPALNCGNKDHLLWYPAEVLQIRPYQLCRRRVPDALVPAMHAVACHHPKDTRALIEHEGLRKLGLSPSGGFAPFVSPSLLPIYGRIGHGFFETLTGCRLPVLRS